MELICWEFLWLIMCGAIKSKWLSVRGISFRNWHLIFVQISWPLPYSVCRGAFSYYKLAAYHVWEKRKNNYFIVLFLHKKAYVPRALSPLLILGYGVERDGYIYISVKHVVDEVIYQGGPCNANMVAVLLACSHIYIGSWQWGVTATSFFWGKQEGLPPTELY